VIGGWQLQPLIVLRSGVPYTPIISGDQANTGVGNQRPKLESEWRIADLQAQSLKLV